MDEVHPLSQGTNGVQGLSSAIVGVTQSLPYAPMLQLPT